MKKQAVYTRLEPDVVQSVKQMARNLGGLSMSATIRLLVIAALTLMPERIIALASQTQDEH